MFGEAYIPLLKYSNGIISLDLGFVFIVCLIIALADWLSKR